MIRELTEIVSSAERTAKEALIRKIGSFPHERIEGMNRIGHGLFTVSAKALSENNLIMDPFYYDLEKQYETVIANVEKRNFQDAVQWLQKIVKTNKIDDRRIHPNVAANLKSLFDDAEKEACNGTL